MTTRQSNEAAFLALLPILVLNFPDYNLVLPSEHQWQAYFQHKTDSSKAIGFHPDHDKGKFTISPRIIKTPHYSFAVYNSERKEISSPTVGFSVDRPVVQLVKGINTRFMPDFENYYSAWIYQWNLNHNYKTGTENSAWAVGGALGLTPEKIATGDKVRTTFSPYSSSNPALKTYISSVFVSSENSIEIKTNYLTLEQATKLIEFIKTIQ